MGSNELSRRELLRLSVLGASATVVAGCANLKPSSDPVHSSVEVPRLDGNYLKSFMALSEELTGVKLHDYALGAQYLERYANNPIVGPYLQDLLGAYKSIALLSPQDQPAALKSHLLDPTALLRPAAEQLVYLWYTSAFALRDQANPNKIIWQYGDEHQYNEALVWKVIHSHPMMTTPSEWVDAPRYQ